MHKLIILENGVSCKFEFAGYTPSCSACYIGRVELPMRVVNPLRAIARNGPHLP